MTGNMDGSVLESEHNGADHTISQPLSVITEEICKPPCRPTPPIHTGRRKYGNWSPEDGVTLTWRDLSVYAPVTKDERIGDTPFKRIVNNVTGAVRPGTLVAMMGGSGAGKSTLMSALAFRSTAGMMVDGDIRVNGRPVGAYMQHMSGFMHQEDLFVGSLTVREHLSFMARMRMDRRTTNKDRNKHVRDILQQLGLLAQADTIIGESGSGKVLSGGEKKRLSFATEILTDPPLLFCDEPTTGLDSYSAQTIVYMMQLMASQGKTVVCTIHQPSSELFALFHQLVLVADGRIAFMGDQQSAIDFFSEHGYNCPAMYNPADFFIRTLAIAPGSEESSRNAIRRLCDEFAVSEAAQEVNMLVAFEEHMGSSYDLQHMSVAVSGEFGWSTTKPPFWTTKLLLLIYRALLQVLRDPTIQGLRILQKIAIALMAGLCYLGTVSDTQIGVQSIQGALFIFVTENTFTPMYSVLANFPTELPLFLREHRSGLYNTEQFYLAKIIATLPGLILEPVLFVLIAYWMVGLRNSFEAFVLTAFVTTMTMNVSAACGLFFSAAFDSVNIAMAYLVPFDYVLMITSGVFVKLSTLPEYISWVRYMSWLMYSNEAMSIVQWHGVTNITCDATDPDLPCLRTGVQVLEKYSFAERHFYQDLVAMASLYVIFHVMGCLCLWRRACKK